MIKGAKTIAEYAIRKWLDQEGFAMDFFAFKMVAPQEAMIRDKNGDELRLIYNPATNIVIPTGMAHEDT